MSVFEVDKIIFQISAKNLPAGRQNDTNPYFRLLRAGEPSLKDGKVSKSFKPLYQSEIYVNSRYPQWLTFELDATQIDFGADLTIEIANLNVWGCNDYMCECTFKPDEFRSQFTQKPINLIRKLSSFDAENESATEVAAGYALVRRRIVANNGVLAKDSCPEQDYRTFDEVVDDFHTHRAIRREQEAARIEAELKQQFDLFDIDGNGSIDCDEFCKILPEVWGLEVSREEVEQLIAKVDSNNDGNVDFEEFINCVNVLKDMYADKVRNARRNKKLKLLAEAEEREAAEALAAEKARLAAEAEEFERQLAEKQAAEAKLAELALEECFEEKLEDVLSGGEEAEEAREL